MNCDLSIAKSALPSCHSAEALRRLSGSDSSATGCSDRVQALDYGELAATWSLLQEMDLTKFVPRLLGGALHAAGISPLMFPAVPLPRSDEESRGCRFVLWGLTLGIVADFMAAGGLPVHPSLGYDRARDGSRIVPGAPGGAGRVPLGRARWHIWTPAIRLMLYLWRTHLFHPGRALIIGVTVVLGLVNSVVFIVYYLYAWGRAIHLA
ncbi:hypothetical protein CYMTET_19347 [Cymbomonas tetramitiformis]|uniref:Uncharacterized protein n=1 Tax=Cymbomonas tetramitiformis TaxID=36881 RepID=A0AAE0L5B2_9CHLO|nr:hypothetical protein CYMTET_19347 [Cymbomonas tetramitiformis]